jgi:hypothetical protein
MPHGYIKYGKGIHTSDTVQPRTKEPNKWCQICLHIIEYFCLNCQLEPKLDARIKHASSLLSFNDTLNKTYIFDQIQQWGYVASTFFSVHIYLWEKLTRSSAQI